MGETKNGADLRGWFNLTGRSTISATIPLKTESFMLEAYKKHKTLKALEAQLPRDAAQVKQTLENESEESHSDNLVLFILARCQVLCEQRNEAKQTLGMLISRAPDQVSAKIELAKILFDENDLKGAIRLVQDVTQARPELDEYWLLLSEYLRLDGQQQASEEALIQYDMIKAYNDTLGVAEKAFASGEFVKADKLCRKLLAHVNGEVRALRLLARLAKRFHHFEISTSILSTCIETQPYNATLGLEYANSLLANHKYQQALDQCDRLIGVAPENIDIYDLKAEVLYHLGRYEEANAIYQELSGTLEKRASAFLQMGKLLKTIGETRQAISCFHEVVNDELRSAEAYWELASLKTYRFLADEISAMQKLLKAGEVSAVNEVLIQFALGKALEDEKQFAESFRHYEAANSGYNRIQGYRYSSQNVQLKSLFNAEYFSGHKESGNTSDAPIFVVGMPRSGSTLVEQILTCHSKVDATGELTEIMSIARDLNNSEQPALGQYLQSMANIGANQIQELAQRYLDFAQIFRRQAPHFVDKAPGNFHHIGLIKTLFPNARIIDIRRNPMASGWSLYRHFFSDSFPFSYDLATIGKYYNDYIELMDHWHTVLPGQILTVYYEDLIKDLPAVVDRLLAYCGLSFEEACLDFHLNKRAVATPSSEQVRQPIYEGALDHWKNYEEFLAPLKNAVGNT
jgi:tetratricopeptide (TPR) repeat protein